MADILGSATTNNNGGNKKASGLEGLDESVVYAGRFESFLHCAMV